MDHRIKSGGDEGKSLLFDIMVEGSRASAGMIFPCAMREPCPRATMLHTMNFDLISPLPLAECIRRLRAATDSGFAIAGSKPVLGSVGDTSIRLRRRTYYRHSSQYWLSGQFVEEGGETSCIAPWACIRSCARSWNIESAP
ncbi:MAG: hypothetical protein WB774_10620 [Xanthobacteraceae bacterium]